MASSKDTGLTAVVVILVLLAGASQSTGAPPSAVGTADPSPAEARVSGASRSSNIPGGPLAACTGDLLSTDRVGVGERGELTLQVFYSSDAGGRNCALVTRSGSARALTGEMVVTLQFHSYDGRTWPRYATQRTTSGYRSGGIYLDRTDDRCVRASARFTPDVGRPAKVTSGKVGCR